MLSRPHVSVITPANKAKVLSAVWAMALLGTAASAGPTSYQYDDFGRLVSVKFADGVKTNVYTYDAADNRASASTIDTPSPNVPFTVTSNVNLRNFSGYTGTAPVNYTFTVPSTATLVAQSGTNNNVAIDTGDWPLGSNITLIIEGKVYGFGGKGGNGGSNGSGTAGTPGARGGDAILARYGVSISVSGELKGGGGGGAGGPAVTAPMQPAGNTSGGGGGGGGFPNGLGGQGGTGTFQAGPNGGNASLSPPAPGGGVNLPGSISGSGGYPGFQAAGSSTSNTGTVLGGGAGYAVKLQTGVSMTCPSAAGVQGGCGT